MVDDYDFKFMNKDELKLVLNDICYFDTDLFNEHAYTKEIWTDKINGSQYAITVRHKGVLIGLIITSDHGPVENCLSYIISLGVCEMYRKKGIGSMLLKYLENKLSPTLENFCISLDVDKENNTAIRLYNKHGYNVLKDNEHQQHIMIKTLT